MSTEYRDDSTGSGYDTPVPEFDDHRFQVPTIQLPERARRGTFDSLYAAAQLGSVEGDLFKVHSHAIDDEILDDDDAPSPRTPRSRRPTVDSVLTAGSRGPSPPNSVKAFAEARRCDRGMSVSESCGEDVASIRSGRSIYSKRSFISKRQTIQDAECASIQSNLTAEEDVCFPLQDEHRSGGYVDFNILENFILAEAEQEALERQASNRSFPNLVQPTKDYQQSSAIMTAEGDFIGMQPVLSEKIEPDTDSLSVKSKTSVKAAKQQQPIDNNRFSFFSSAWESTAHASSLGGLLFGGEDVRHLFSFPKDEPDGVWWLNVAFPTEDEVRTICKAFGIHPLTVEDIITQEPREKIELFPSYYFASFRSFTIETEDGEVEYEPFSCYVVVFRQGTLSFTYAQNGHASHVRKRIGLLKDYVALSSDWICYALMYVFRSTLLFLSTRS